MKFYNAQTPLHIHDLCNIVNTTTDLEIFPMSIMDESIEKMMHIHTKNVVYPLMENESAWQDDLCLWHENSKEKDRKITNSLRPSFPKQWLSCQSSLHCVFQVILGYRITCLTTNPKARCWPMWQTSLNLRMVCKVKHFGQRTIQYDFMQIRFFKKTSSVKQWLVRYQGPEADNEHLLLRGS